MFVFGFAGFSTVSAGLGFAAWVAIGGGLAPVSVLGPFRCHRMVSEDSGHCLVRRATAQASGKSLQETLKRPDVEGACTAKV